MNQKSSDRANRILGEYFAGPLPRELEERILAWYIYDPWSEEKEVVLEKIWEQEITFDRHPEQSVVHELIEMKERLGLPPITTWYTTEKTPKRKNVPLRRRLMLRVAAILLPFLLLAGAAYWWVDGGFDFGRQPRLTEFTAPTTSGTTKTIALPDGTQVELQPSSMLAYAADFEESRKVSLSGAADFNVTRQTDDKPFTVVTDRLSVTVLGTIFNVAAYPETEQSVITLYSGSVKVDYAHSSAMLKRGEELTCHHVTGRTTLRTLSVQEMLDKGFAPSLALNNVTLGEIIQSVGANHHVIFDIPAGFDAGGSYSVDFEQESLGSILLLLHDLNEDYLYENNGNSITITKTK